jgi:L-fucose isomerase-like protein
MKVKPRVGCYAVYETAEEGWEEIEAQFKQIITDLAKEGVEVIPAPEAVSDLASCERVAAWFVNQQLDLLYALIVTWSFDHYSIMIQQQVGVPIAIRSIPGIRSGSLVAGEQLNCILADLGWQHRLFFGALDNQEVLQDTIVYARACAIYRRLKGVRLAVVGRRTEGMTPTAVDEVEILRLFGIRLLNYGLDELKEKIERVAFEEAEITWHRIASAATKVTSSAEQGIATARAYLALKQMINELSLQAVSIGSYPQCQGWMCLPIALLNEEGIASGCEGDVNSTIAMFILTMLTGKPVHFGEMLEVNINESTIVSSHCGCGSPSLADNNGYLLCPVRLANDGVCIRYTARPGAVTFVNLVGRKGNYRMCAFEGEAIPTEMVFEGNPLKFITQTPFRKIWQVITEGGYGHHWMTVYAHVAAELKAYCNLAGIEGIFPDID